MPREEVLQLNLKSSSKPEEREREEEEEEEEDGKEGRRGGGVRESGRSPVSIHPAMNQDVHHFKKTRKFFANSFQFYPWIPPLH